MTTAEKVRSYDYVNHPYEKVRDALSADPLAVFQAAKMRRSDSRDPSRSRRRHWCGIVVALAALGARCDADERGTSIETQPTASPAPSASPSPTASALPVGSHVRFTSTNWFLGFLPFKSRLAGEVAAVSETMLTIETKKGPVAISRRSLEKGRLEVSAGKSRSVLGTVGLTLLGAAVGLAAVAYQPEKEDRDVYVASAVGAVLGAALGSRPQHDWIRFSAGEVLPAPRASWTVTPARDPAGKGAGLRLSVEW